MTIPITMPQLGETVLEGTIIRWLKQVGETVAADEPLFEISTDKVDTEIPSPAAGTLSAILVPEGETVSVGTELATIDDGAGEPGGSGDTGLAAVPGAARSSDEGPDGTETRPQVSPPAGGGPRSSILSPIVRKMAAEHGVDLGDVTGTGAGGRITKGDIEAYLAADRPAAASTTGLPKLRVVPASGGAREDVVPLSHIRKRIAEHMHQSVQASARAWSMVDVDLENVARLRDREKQAFREREGAALTYLPFVARAVCDALTEYPPVNAELRGDDLVLHRYVNLGIAVAYDEGLIVPVITDADSMNLVGLARAIGDIASRARAKRLSPDEVHGATFTITNPGPFGSVMSVPIINQPNTAILSLDAVEKRPVVIDDAIAIRHRVYLSMSWDHRVIDGAVASQFLARVKTNLETWDFTEDLGR